MDDIGPTLLVSWAELAALVAALQSRAFVDAHEVGAAVTAALARIVTSFLLRPEVRAHSSSKTAHTLNRKAEMKQTENSAKSTTICCGVVVGGCVCFLFLTVSSFLFLRACVFRWLQRSVFTHRDISFLVEHVIVPWTNRVAATATAADATCTLSHACATAACLVLSALLKHRATAVVKHMPAWVHHVRVLHVHVLHRMAEAVRRGQEEPPAVLAAADGVARLWEEMARPLHRDALGKYVCASRWVCVCVCAHVCMCVCAGGIEWSSSDERDIVSVPVSASQSCFSASVRVTWCQVLAGCGG